MKIIRTALIILTSFVVIACYKEDPITSELGKPKHEIEYKDNPVDSYIYDLYNSTGVFLLYEFEEMDYKWNMGATALSTYDMNRQTDRAILEDGINYLDKVLMDYYNDDFKTKYFPLTIFLCDSIRRSGYEESLPTLIGRNYLAIGQIDDNLTSLTADDLNELKGLINGQLWGDIIYTNNLMRLPDEFFAPCDEYYGLKIGENTDNPPFDARRFGFWEKDESTSTSYAYMAPRRELDIAQFVEMITTHTYEELVVQMTGYPILLNKYIILTNFLKTEYNLDLQAIGDQKPTTIVVQ